MGELDLPQDYVDLLRELAAGDVEHVLVGGWAVAVHGYVRATDDLDVLVRASPENAARVYAALERFGAPLEQHGVTEGLFATEHYGYRMGHKPLQIEVLTSIDGVTFDQACENAVTVDVDTLRVPVIGRAALLANKRTAGRPKDIADVAGLEGND